MARAPNNTYSGNKIAEDFHNTIYDISPTDTPLLSLAKRFKATNTLHQWTYDALTAAASNSNLEGNDYTITARAQPTTLGNYCRFGRTSSTRRTHSRCARTKSLLRSTFTIRGSCASCSRT